MISELRSGICFFLFLCCSGSLKAQATFPGDTIYPFIAYEKNHIIGRAHLAPFYQQLKSLRQDADQVLRITHIGDSHIQADFFPGRMRSRLQKTFGCAGRGLVFPYQVAGTHSPLDLRSESAQEWIYRRTIFQRNGLSLGISGMSLRTPETTFDLHLYLRDRYGIDYAFDKITFFLPRGQAPFGWVVEVQEAGPGTSAPSVYRVQPGETLYGLARRFDVSVAAIRAANQLSGDQLRIGQEIRIPGARGNFVPSADDLRYALFQQLTPSTCGAYSVQLTSAVTGFTLSGTGNHQPTDLHGILLEKTGAGGILYHTIGVNGTTFYHYNEAAYFFDELVCLPTDLFVIHLGTNEALAADMQEARFRAEVRQFLERLRALHPGAAVLLTTNPDTHSRKSNAVRQDMVRRVILEEAPQFRAAVWDLQSVMGGPGAMEDWVNAGLGHTDYVHFTREGYELQADLLYAALLTGAYERY